MCKSIGQLIKALQDVLVYQLAVAIWTQVLPMKPLAPWSQRFLDMPRVSKWEMLARSSLVEQERRHNREWLLEDVGLNKVEAKLPELSLEQKRCPHAATKPQNNQWCRTVVCRSCAARLRYWPTSLAVEAVLAKKNSPSRRDRASMSRPEARRQLTRDREDMGTSSAGVPNFSESMSRIEGLLTLSAETAITTQNLVERLALHTGTLTNQLEVMSVGMPTQQVPPEQVPQGMDVGTNWYHLDAQEPGNRRNA